MRAVRVCGREMQSRDSVTIAKAQLWTSGPTLWNWSSHYLSDPCHLGWLFNLCLGFAIWKDEHNNNIYLVGCLEN